MNIRDSEAIVGLLLEEGFGVTEEETKADAILLLPARCASMRRIRFGRRLAGFLSLRPSRLLG